MNKWICIKEYKDECVHFKIGDFASIIEYDSGNTDSGNIYIGQYNHEGGAIPMWGAGRNIFKYFITLSQWREQQINSILDE